MNHDLFTQSAQQGEQLKLADAELTLYRSFYPQDQADQLFETLRDKLPWQQDQITVAGKAIAIPRLQAWFGEAGLDYTYSGLRMTPTPFSAELEKIRQRIQALTQTPFNSVLANLYRDGQDSVGWHSDDEPELGNNPTIASLSLGGTRRFLLKHKRNKLLPTFELSLHHGDLLIMGGTTQRYWRHQVPKTRLQVSPRINLTFRRIIQ